MTLIEVLISITLLSLLMTGMLWAIRIGVNSMGRANDRLTSNRRVMGAQKILEQEIAGLMPVAGMIPPGQANGNMRFAFFQGEPGGMRFVSSYSLEEASRGVPRILEFLVIPGAEGKGVRLIVNELPYTGPVSAGALALGRAVNQETGTPLMLYVPIEQGPRSFVLADRLAKCRLVYQELKPRPEYERWTEYWGKETWPDAVRVEMTPLEEAAGAKLRMTTVTVPIHARKRPLEQYADQ